MVFMSDNCFLMQAIDYVDDEYLKKYFNMKESIASKKSKKKIRVIRWSVSVAACLCLVFVTIISINLLHVHEQNNPIIQPHNIVWADSTVNESIIDYYNQATLGTVVITDTLKTSMADTNYNKSTLFAVRVTDTTGSEITHIYNSFIKKLNAREDYLASGIIFLTRSQIDSLECPPDLAIILSLASNPNE